MRTPHTIALLSALMIAAAPTPAQDAIHFSDKYTVELGKPYPVIDGTKRYFEAEGSVICVKNDGHRWFVQKLSTDGLTQTHMKQYEDMPDDMEVEYVGWFGKRLLLFYSLWDKANEREQLFYREVDPEAGEFMGKGTKLLSVNGKVSGTMAASGFYRFHVTDKFDFIFSADEEHLVVQYQRRRERKDDDPDLKISVAVFNSALEEQWKADVRMPHKAKDMFVRDYAIDAKGDICIIASVYKGTAEKDRDRKETEWEYEFMRCSDQGVSWETTPLDMSDRQLLSLSLFEGNDGALRAGGFYKKNPEQYGADGVFIGSFNASDEFTDLHFYEIPTAMINMYVTKREVKRNAKEEEKGEDLGLSSMELNRVFLDADGALLLVGEQRYTTVQCYTDSRGGTHCYTLWHADDLLICSLDSKGGLVWMKRVPKRMSSSAPIGDGYKYMYGGNAHHFVHFDNSSNLDLPENETPSYKGDPVIVADVLDDASGTMSREALLNPDEVKGIHLYQLSMDRLVRTGDGELLMEAYKKQKEDVLVRIAIRE